MMTRAAIDLAIATTPREQRAALQALFALDVRLGAILQSTREPMVGQMRLAWWREALARLDGAPPPAEPVLADVTDLVLVYGVKGGDLAAMTEGWEALLTSGDSSDGNSLATFAEARGGALFAAAATILGALPPPAAGEGWALADLASKLTDGDAADRARALADVRLRTAFSAQFPRAARPLGVLALLAGFELRGIRPLADTISLVGFRWTGRHRLDVATERDSLPR